MIRQFSVSGKTRVIKTGRAWQTINGDGQPVERGTGLVGWRNAMLAALGHDHPESSRVVDALWRTNGCSLHLMDRLIKAAILVAKDKIFLVNLNDNEVTTRVESQRHAREYYTVTWGGIPARYRCTCPDFCNDAPFLPGFGQKMCKHALATHLAALLGQTLPEPIPFQGEPVVYK